MWLLIQSSKLSTLPASSWLKCARTCMPSFSIRYGDRRTSPEKFKKYFSSNSPSLIFWMSMAVAHSLDWSLSSGFNGTTRKSIQSSQSCSFTAKAKFSFPFISFLLLDLNYRAVREDSSACSPPLLEEDAPVIEMDLKLQDFEQPPESLPEDCEELNGLICSLFTDSLTETLGYECYQRSKGRPDFKPQRYTLKLLIRHFIRLEKWDLLFLLCDDLKVFGVLPDRGSCCRLISACVKARKFKLVNSFLEVFLECDVEIALLGFDSAMKGCNQLHMYSITVVLYQKIKSAGIDLNQACCSRVMEAYLKMGQYGEAVAIFQEMKKRKMSRIGLFSSQIYLILCESLGKMGRPVEALYSFRAMLKKGIPENHKFYSSLICSLASGGELIMAEALLQEGESKKMLRDPALFLKLVLRYVEEGMMQKTLDVVETMKRVSIRATDCILCAIVNGFCKKRGANAAVQVYEDLVLQGHEPGQVTYASALSMYISLGLYPKAEAVFSAMEKRGYDKCVVAYSSMVAAYAKTERASDALRLVAKMKQRGCHPNVWTYNSLLEMSGRVLNFKQLEKTWKEVKRRKITPNRVSYTIMISAYNRAREYEMCAKYYEEFKLTGEKVDAAMAGILVAVFSKTNRIDELVDLLQDMKTEKTKFDTRFYRSAMNALRDAGLQVQAKWLEETFKKS